MRMCRDAGGCHVDAPGRHRHRQRGSRQCQPLVPRAHMRVERVGEHRCEVAHPYAGDTTPHVAHHVPPRQPRVDGWRDCAVWVEGVGRDQALECDVELAKGCLKAWAEGALDVLKLRFDVRVHLQAQAQRQQAQLRT